MSLDKLAEKIAGNTRSEAATIVGEAKTEAKKIKSEAQQEAATIAERRAGSGATPYRDVGSSQTTHPETNAYR